jgi:hypothetical protein
MMIVMMTQNTSTKFRATERDIGIMISVHICFWVLGATQLWCQNSNKKGFLRHSL